MAKKISPKQLKKDVDALEPKNIIDYIFQGSGLNRWLRENTKWGKKL